MYIELSKEYFFSLFLILNLTVWNTCRFWQVHFDQVKMFWKLIVHSIVVYFFLVQDKRIRAHILRVICYFSWELCVCVSVCVLCLLIFVSFFICLSPLLCLCLSPSLIRGSVRLWISSEHLPCYDCNACLKSSYLVEINDSLLIPILGPVVIGSLCFVFS